MRLQLIGHHIKITPAIKKYTTEKLKKVTNHFSQIINIDITFSIDNLDQVAEANMHVAGKDIHVKVSSHDLYISIDSLINKLDREIIKHKNKITNHKK